MAKKWHPDRHQSGTDEQRLKAEKMFKEINEANQVLSDKDKRRQYDLGGYDYDNPDAPAYPPDSGFGNQFTRSSGGGGPRGG